MFEMDAGNSNSSPNIVGVKEWSMCRESVKDLLGPNYSTYFVLNFYHQMSVPEFGLSALSPKQLFWHEIEENVSARHSDCVLVHQWTLAEDAQFWKTATCDMEKSVVITLEAMQNEPTKIKIMFSCGNKNSAFIFKLCPIIQDAYLMFFVPYLKFRDGHLSLLSSLHYLEEFMSRMCRGRHRRNSLSSFGSSIGLQLEEQLGDMNQCIICQALTEVVFLPCGHASYCIKCSKKTKDPRCPICRHNIYERYNYKLSPARRCLSCPSRFDCHRMDCMLLPCRCVVGCKQYTDLAVQRDQDPCPACGQLVEEIVKVFIQQEQ